MASAEFSGTAAPLTVKAAPGSVWNTAPSAGLLTQSCAQATPGAQHQRHGAEHRQIVGAGAEFAAGIVRGLRIVGQPEAAAGEIGLAVARRVEPLRLQRGVGRDARPSAVTAKR